MISIFSVISLAQTIPNDKKFYFSGNSYTAQNDIENLSGYNEITQSANLRYNYTGVYNSTYSFGEGGYLDSDNEVGDTGTDIEFVDSLQGNFEAEILDSIDGHSNVLESNASDNNRYIINNFESNIVQGKIEVWVKYESALSYIMLEGNDASTICIYVRFFSDRIHLIYGNGAGGTDIKEVFMDTTKWTHIKVEFNCIDDTWSCWVNSKLEVQDVPFRDDTTATSMYRLRLYHNIGITYWDAMSYSWDSNYTIGENLFPNTHLINNTYESRYQDFTFTDYDTLYSSSQNDVPYYSEEEGAASDIKLSTTEYAGALSLQMYTDDFSAMDWYIEANRTYHSLPKGNIIDFNCKVGIGVLANGSAGGLVDYGAKWGMLITRYQDGTADNPYIGLYLSSRGIENEIINASFIVKDNDGNVKVVNLTDNAFEIDPSTGFPSGRWVDIGFKFDNSSGLIKVNLNGTYYYVNGAGFSIQEKLFYKFNLYNGDGSEHPYFDSFNSVYIDLIEIRVGGRSMSNWHSAQLDSIGFLEQKTIDNSIDKIKIKGNYSIGTFTPFNSSGVFILNIAGGNYDWAYRSESNTLKLIRELSGSYNNHYFCFNSSELVLNTYEFYPNISLLQGENEYFMEYSYDSLIKNITRFTSHNGSLIVNVSCNELYMNFDVKDFLTTNLSINTYLLKNNWKYKLTFITNFTDKTDMLMTLPIDDDPIYLENAYSRDLAPYKNIDAFSYNLTTTTGYSVVIRLDPILLKYIYRYPIPELSNSGIFALLVPLMVIFIPSLGISGAVTERGGKEAGKLVFLPMSLIFSIVFSINGLVPLWLVFMLALLTISYFLIRKRGEIF